MKQPLTPGTVISAQADLLTSQLSESEMVMMNMDAGSYYGLEDVGKLLWEAMAEPHSVAQLCEIVLAHYGDVDRETVEQDLLVFLRELMEEDLIVIHHAE